MKATGNDVEILLKLVIENYVLEAVMPDAFLNVH